METSHLKKLSGWLKSNLLDLFLILLIVGTAVFVAYKNFIPGTWLLGWDDLVPELNFKLNILRSLSAAWQEYQGVGLLGGMAHAADLPRQLILWAFSLVIPISFLRYFWTFLMLVTGPLGVYWLVRQLCSGNNTPSSDKVPPCQLAGFTASMFYLFNLATVQTFYTPFETFVGFFGLVPWLLYFAVRYLSGEERVTRRNLVSYALVLIVGAGAFYVQTLFIVYAIFLLVLAIETIIKRGKIGIVLSTRLGIITLCISAFWLLPVAYFSLTSGAVPGMSHINQIATPETQIMNLAKANFTDIATLKGYWFNYFDWDKAGTTYDYLYKPWIGYSSQPLVQKISIALFAVSVLGLFLSLFKKKTYFGASFLVLLGISYFFLDGGTIPFIPLFSEIFRNVFTKWANALSLVLSIGLGYFVFIVADFFRNKFVKIFVSVILAGAIVFGSVYTVMPIFEGKLIAEGMRVSAPSYYFDTINYFKTQDATKRIANFPLTDLWGWKYTDWGYRGSFFSWYGIPQPILDRTFDVWSKNNESFYTEVAHAVEAENADELKYVLNKYQVSFILFDESVIMPGTTDSTTQPLKQKDFLETVPFITKTREFGKISVYEVRLTESIALFVSAPKYDYSSQFLVTGAVGEPVVRETFPTDQGYVTANNCDIKNRGGVIKEKRDGGNYYEASSDGVSCDYFYYPTLDYSQAYSMRITGSNTAGRSLKFYLYNIKKGNIDLQELLPTGEFDESYLILPTSESSSSAEVEDQGFTLSVETRSFGKIKSENLITGITFSPVDISTFKGSSFKGNDLNIVNVKKRGTWGYEVKTNGSGVLELGQGYDDGWIAIQTQNSNLISQIYNSKLKILTHTKANSWSNGWIVEKSQISNLKSQIWIVFWPQLLEWGGMVLGVISLLILVCPTIKVKSLDTPTK